MTMHRCVKCGYEEEDPVCTGKRIVPACPHDGHDMRWLYDMVGFCFRKSALKATIAAVRSGLSRKAIPEEAKDILAILYEGMDSFEEKTEYVDPQKEQNFYKYK